MESFLLYSAYTLCTPPSQADAKKKKNPNRFSFVTVVYPQLVTASYTSGPLIVGDSKSSHEALLGRTKLPTLHNRRPQDMAISKFKGKSYLYPD